MIFLVPSQRLGSCDIMKNGYCCYDKILKYGKKFKITKKLQSDFFL
jgi:hypothetical protein